MSAPEDALAAARARAAERRAAYEAEELPGLEVEPGADLDPHLLLEVSLVEPDVEGVRSTRALGAPITAAKRGLVRALRQYVGDLAAQVTRFNRLSAIHIRDLERRVGELEGRIAELEDELARRDGDGPGRPPGP